MRSNHSRLLLVGTEGLEPEPRKIRRDWLNLLCQSSTCPHCRNRVSSECRKKCRIVQTSHSQSGFPANQQSRWQRCLSPPSETSHSDLFGFLPVASRTQLSNRTRLRLERALPQPVRTRHS